MIYFGSAYSNSDPLQVKTNYLLVKEATEFLIYLGHKIYSPIVHCHELSIPSSDGSFAFWKEYNIDMLRRADDVWFFDVPLLRKSVGCKAEFELAIAVGFTPKFVAIVQDSVVFRETTKWPA